jgi:hypothetical protein
VGSSVQVFMALSYALNLFRDVMMPNVTVNLFPGPGSSHSTH